jgi:hypothetical protein
LAVRSAIPAKMQIFHQLLAQMEALDEGERQLADWCERTEAAVAEAEAAASPADRAAATDHVRAVSAQKSAMRALVQSRRNLYQAMLDGVDGKDGVDTAHVMRKTEDLNNRQERFIIQKLLGFSLPLDY